MRKTRQIRPAHDASERLPALQLSAQLPTRSPSLSSSDSFPLLMDNPSRHNLSNRKRKWDEAQTNSPLPSALHASGSAEPSIPAPLNAAGHTITPTAPSIRRARSGGDRCHPNPPISVSEQPLEDQPAPASLTHKSPSIPINVSASPRSAIRSISHRLPLLQSHYCQFASLINTSELSRPSNWPTAVWAS